jgi:intracellular sulfur oxidation DsrE/DsrF family protein
MRKHVIQVLLSSFVALGCASSPGLPPPSDGVELRHTDDVRAVFQASDDDWRDGVSRALFYADKIQRVYERRGVARQALHFVVVFHGEAGYHLLNDAAFAAYDGEREREGDTNPNAALVRTLTERGVRVELCSSTMEQRGWSESDLLPEVVVVPNAYPRIIDLQMDGYAHLLFD